MLAQHWDNTGLVRVLVRNKCLIYVLFFSGAAVACLWGFVMG